jgi:hypothetical protein
MCPVDTGHNKAPNSTGINLSTDGKGIAVVQEQITAILSDTLCLTKTVCTVTVTSTVSGVITNVTAEPSLSENL